MLILSVLITIILIMSLILYRYNKDINNLFMITCIAGIILSLINIIFTLMR